jgi:hypothetical protein
VRRGRRALAVAFAGWLAAAGATGAQVAAPEAGATTRVPGAGLTVYLMTMGPGARVWERFGHNAIYIHDPARGTDLAYNYGLFDLRQERFLLRFIQGRMWYWMAGYPAQRYLDQYVRDNRSVWLQELEMPPAARLELQRFLEWNALPEHRFYHYDYYRDNCSTRVRDALDRVLGGRIRAQTDSLATGTTYRFHTQRLTANDLPTFTGLLLALGPGTDRPISAWEEMFLPLKLREHVRAVTVPGPGGGALPLVRGETTLFTSSEPDPPAAPPRWIPWYLLLGLGLGGAMVLLGRAAEGSRAARVALAVGIGGWGLACGVAGMILAGLWGFTDHVMAYRNENLFQANPAALLLPLLVVPWLRGGADGRRRLRGVAAVLAGSAVLGGLLQMLPGLNQVNGPIIALALPVHLGIAAALRRAR